MTDESPESWNAHRLYVVNTLEEIKQSVKQIHDDVLTLKVKNGLIAAGVAAAITIAGIVIPILF